MSDYKVIVDDSAFSFDKTDLQKLDLINKGTDSHLIHDNKSYHIEVLHIQGKNIRLKLDNAIYEVKIQDKVDQMISDMGLDKVKEVILNNIQAPMPGLILDILVEPGQSISPGDPILILEAMKMENVIKAEGSGTIKSILLEKGAAVEKNQVIIEME